MTRTLARTVLAVTAFALAVPAIAAPKDEVQKPLKTLIASVRFSKDQAALKQFAGEAQAKALTTDDWEKATPEQRKEFISLFQTLFAKMAFPKIRGNFKHLSTVLYEEPKIDGTKANVGSTIVIEHPMKKQELKVKYDLVKEGKQWKVVDVAVLGDSMLTGVRENQIKPLLKEGGWDLLLKTMRERAKELESVKIK